MKVRKEWIGSPEPATKGDLADLQEDLHADMSQLENRLGTKMDQMEGRILHEFKALAENIHKDVAGANKDEISSIKDQVKAIQQHVGLELA